VASNDRNREGFRGFEWTFFPEEQKKGLKMIFNQTLSIESIETLLKRRSIGSFQTKLDMTREKGFNPVRVHVDPQKALQALVGKFPGTEIDVQGAGDHLAVVDNKSDE
jgi:hypothetical protein